MILQEIMMHERVSEIENVQQIFDALEKRPVNQEQTNMTLNCAGKRT